MSLVTKLQSHGRRNAAIVLAIAVAAGGVYGGVRVNHSSAATDATKAAASSESSTGAIAANDSLQTQPAGSKLSPVTGSAKTGSTTTNNKITAGSASPSATAPTVSANAISLGLYSGSVTPGQSFTVRVYENSGATTVNAVQASLIFNPAVLEYVTVSQTGSFDVAAATDTSTAGTVRLARGITTGPVTGTQPVADITFKVRPSASGTASFQLDSQQSDIVRTPDAVNILQTVSGANFPIGQ